MELSSTALNYDYTALCYLQSYGFECSAITSGGCVVLSEYITLLVDEELDIHNYSAHGHFELDAMKAILGA